MAKSPVKRFSNVTALPAGPVWVGIDQSLTGFAVAVISSPTRFGAKFEVDVYRSPQKGVDRLHDISVFLRDTLVRLEGQGNPVQDIAMEGTIRSSPSASVLGELSGVVKMTLLEHASGASRYPTQVPPSTLKKFITGHGNASKADVMASVAARVNFVVPDDNAADALALAFIAAQSTTGNDDFAVLVSLFSTNPREMRG